MSLNDDDSMFERALKSDLPSADEQARLRKRLLAAGLSVGSGLAATSTASAQVGWGATVVAKVLALPWPMTLVLGAAVATPIVALPVWLSPGKASHAASNAAPVRSARSAMPLAVSPPSVTGPELNPEPASAPNTESGIQGDAPRPVQRAASSALRAPEPSSVAASAAPAVAAFATPNGAASVDSARGASTLAAETQLLDRAFAELAAGHRSSAATLIQEHQRRFPNGLLSQERERARARLEQNSKGE
jgi:hypothetical protein